VRENMIEKGNKPSRQGGFKQQQCSQLYTSMYALKVYNTFGCFTTEKRVIREHIKMGVVL